MQLSGNNTVTSLCSLRVHTCRAMCLRTLLFSVSGSISRWARSSVAQKRSWPNSSKTSLRTSYRYNPNYTCWYKVYIYCLLICFSETWSDWTFMLLDACKRETWDSFHWIGAIPQKPLRPLHQVFISHFHGITDFSSMTPPAPVSGKFTKCLDFVFRTTALAAKLTEFNLGSDKHTFLSKLIKSIFSSYLDSYIDMERQYLQSRSASILQRYYDSKNHQKRSLGTGRWGGLLNVNVCLEV